MRTRNPKFPKCELMTEAEWRSCVSAGMYNGNDGSGCWATETYHDEAFNAFQPKPDWATHVVWFNK